MTLRFEPLSRRHDRAHFRCGEPSLDEFLARYALQNQKAGLTTTHVLIDEAMPRAILGYMSLSAAQVALEDLQEADRARLPRYPVPALRLTRLAVAQDRQGRGYGELLLGEAVNRCCAMREHAGVRVLVVDALHECAAAFYERYGFRPTGRTAGTLYLPLGSR